MFIRHRRDLAIWKYSFFMRWGLKRYPGWRKFSGALAEGWEGVGETPLLAKNARNGAPGAFATTNDRTRIRQSVQENFLTAPNSAAPLLASLLNSFTSGECFAQRGLPARAKLFGGFGVGHEEIESVEGTTHNQEFGCDSGMDEPARVLHVFFDEQVDRTDADPGWR